MSTTKLVLSIDIKAPRETVWNAITTDALYRRWTKAFHETSHFEGGWNTGDKIHFIGINEDGKKEGMVSEIAESRFPEYISVRHLGFIKDGEIDTTSDEVKAWAPMYENYRIEKINDHLTRFHIDMDVEDDWYGMFENMWPKALALLKDVCEENNPGPKTVTVISMVGGEEGKVWAYYTDPDHVRRWNNASDDWHCPSAENDLRVGGRFKYTMAARDGSMSFDFAGTYTAVDVGQRIAYTMDDGRKAEVRFPFQMDKICVITNFEAEGTNPAARRLASDIG